jgi:hypothetical protein
MVNRTKEVKGMKKLSAGMFYFDSSGISERVLTLSERRER